MEETINKKSETEIEVVTVIPEQVIPEKVITQTYSITELNDRLSELNNKKQEYLRYRETPLAELAKIDNDIAGVDDEITSITAKIKTAKDLGVKDVAEISVAPVTEEIINP